MWNWVDAILRVFSGAKTTEASTQTGTPEPGSTGISGASSVNQEGAQGASMQPVTQQQPTQDPLSSSGQASGQLFGTSSTRKPGQRMEELSEQEQMAEVMKAQYAMEKRLRQEQEAKFTQQEEEYRQAKIEAESKREEANKQAQKTTHSKAMKEAQNAVVKAQEAAGEKGNAVKNHNLATLSEVRQFQHVMGDRRSNNAPTATAREMEGDGLMKELYAKANERAEKIEASRKGTQKAKEEFLSNYYLNGFEDPNLQEKRIEDYAKAKNLNQKQLNEFRERQSAENGLTTHHEIVASREAYNSRNSPAAQIGRVVSNSYIKGTYDKASRSLKGGSSDTADKIIEATAKASKVLQPYQDKASEVLQPYQDEASKALQYSKGKASVFKNQAYEALGGDGHRVYYPAFLASQALGPFIYAFERLSEETTSLGSVDLPPENLKPHIPLSPEDFEAMTRRPSTSAQAQGKENRTPNQQENSRKAGVSNPVQASKSQAQNQPKKAVESQFARGIKTEGGQIGAGGSKEAKKVCFTDSTTDESNHIIMKTPGDKKVRKGKENSEPRQENTGAKSNAQQSRTKTQSQRPPFGSAGATTNRNNGRT